MSHTLKLSKSFLLLIGIIVFNLNSIYCQTVGSVHDKYVIVLDVQREYTENTLSPYHAQQLIDSINYVIENVDANKVVYVASFHKMLNLSFSKPFIFVSIDSSSMWDLDSRLILVNDNIILKEESNVFKVEELTNYLKQNNAKDIIVVGLMAEQCVYESLIGGKELGYNMYVLPEAIAAKSQKNKDKTISKLQNNGINTLHLGKD